MKKIIAKPLALLALISSLALVGCGDNSSSSQPSIKPSSEEKTSEPTSESSEAPTEEPTTNPEPWWEDGPFRDSEHSVFVDPKTITIDDNDWHTPKQKAYIVSTWDNYHKVKGVNGGDELSKPRGVKVELTNPSDTYVELSTKEDLSDAYVYQLNNSEEPYVKNLLGNQKYYYRTSNAADGFTGAAKEITTANLFPRNLDIDGVTNVRDLGGYESSLGGHVRQGMIIRGARLNENYQDKVKTITDKGYETLTKVIGVKHELDLRNGADEAGQMDDTVFPDITYHRVEMSTRNIDNLMTEQKPQLKEVFKFLANKDNYPVYVHCKIGTDRTGLVSFLTNALLGVNIDDLMTDYLFSNFGHIGSARQEWDVQEDYYDVLKYGYKKATLQLCVEAFLLEIGITADEIQAIKDIMLVK